MTHETEKLLKLLYDEDENALEYLDDLVCDAIEYRWHDLRKNPNDTPNLHDESEKVECVLENHIYDSEYPCLYYDSESN